MSRPSGLRPVQSEPAAGAGLLGTLDAHALLTGPLANALLGGALVAGSIAACAPRSENDVDALAARTADTPLRVDTVARGLEVPWGLAFAPDGRLFVSERPGRIRVVEDGRLRPVPWAVLEVGATGEAGLLGIAVAPDFERTGHLFAVGTFRGPERIVNRVVRFTEREGRGVDPTVIVDDLPAARFHAGSAIGFGPDGMLYLTTGDARRPELAQRRGSLAGKILRYARDGTLPPDNPFGDSPVYALGLRNVQGVAWHPATGDLLAAEHGPSGFPDERFRRHEDELNVILPGGNYGWAETAGRGGGARFTDPLVVWTPAIAPSGLAVYAGDFAPWSGSAFVAGLRGRQLRRVVLEPAPGRETGWRAAGQEILFDGTLGRLRAVAMGPDGFLYLTTSNRDGRGSPGPSDDLILRIRPAP